MNEMKKYAVRFGLGGGFGGIQFQEPEIVEFDSQEKADEYAYDMAVEEYHSYGGLHGLCTIESIMEENPDYTEEDAVGALQEDIDSWVDYEAVEVQE